MLQFIGIVLNLQITLHGMVILTTLLLPIQEHGISVHLFVSSLISFISILQVLKYKSFASLGTFVTRYFILFDVMVNEIVSLISLCDLSLLVSRNTRDFCVLILQLATLPNSLMSSGFLATSLGVYMYSMSSANSDVLLLFLFHFYYEI